MIDYFARHRTGATLVMLIFILLGFLALPQLQRETYPVFESDSIRVSVSYPGAAAEIIDQAITQRFEATLRGVDGVKASSARSSEGSARIDLEVDPEADFDTVVEEVTSAAQGIRDLPEGAEDPTIRSTRGRRAAAVASVAVTGPMSPQDLKLYCERLRRDLMRSGVITQVTVAGFSTHRVRVRADRAALARHQLTLVDLSNAISAQSLNAPLGTLEAIEGDVLVRYSDRRTSPEELADIVVKGAATGGAVRLGEVAEVADAFAVEAEQTWLNGKRAGLLVVSKTTTQDSLDVLEATKAFLERQETVRPAGVELTLTDDSASVIDERLGLLVTNGVQGLMLVFFTLWLFFGWRMAFWVAAGLPISFLGTFWLMSETGQSINMMTAMGLLIALGLLMDDGIVLADNVAAHLQRGKKPLRAAIDGVSEVAGGVFSSFLTTVCVFLPLTAIDGRIGRTLQVIPVVLIGVLAVSLIEAFFVLPNHLGHALQSPEEHPPGRFRQWFDAKFNFLRDRVLGRVVDACVRYRYVTVGLIVAVFIAASGMVTSGTLKFRSFPQAEGDLAQYKLEMAPGTPFEETKLNAERVAAAAWKVSEELQGVQPDGKPLVRNVTTRFNYNPDVEEPGPHVATISVDLLSVEVRGTPLKDFTAAWRKEVGRLSGALGSSFGAGGRRGPRGSALEVRIEGEDLERMQVVSKELQSYFDEFDGVSDLKDDMVPGRTQATIKLRDDAGSMAVTGASVSSQLRTALSGISVEHMYHRGEEFELFVELQRTARDSIADLEVFGIKTPGGGTVPLGSIASILPVQDFARINRMNGARTVTVSGAVDEDTANAAEIARRFVADKLPELEANYPDIGLVVGGEAEQSAETMGSMARGMILGLFGIFVLLSLQFRTYIEPILVMLAVPFAFVGVVWGLAAIDSPLTTQGLLGFVSLAGVVVNDSILLISFIKRSRLNGRSPSEAASEASRDRFRAVFLTSVTTVAGLVPLMFETSRQAQTLIPVATSIVFGITASTFLVLIGLPAIYVLLADIGLIGEVDKLHAKPGPDDEVDKGVGAEQDVEALA